jgi:hypothetical protein
VKDLRKKKPLLKLLRPRAKSNSGIYRSVRFSTIISCFMKGIRLVIACLCLSVLFACHSTKQEHIDGGPCNYNTRTLQAELLSVDSINPLYYDLTFIASGVQKPGVDTFYYYRLYQHYLDSGIVKRKQLHAGQKLPFRVDNIQSGTCNPLVTWLLLDSL